MKYKFKEGTTVYDISNLKDLCECDFDNMSEEDILSIMGDDFEYQLAKNAHNYVIPSNFIKIIPNTILINSECYYITVSYREVTGDFQNKTVMFYTPKGLVKATPKELGVKVPTLGYTPFDPENNISKHSALIDKLLSRLDVLKFDIGSIELFSACIWGNNAVIQESKKCYVINLNNRKYQELENFVLKGSINNKPILANLQTKSKPLFELDKYLTLLKF